MIEITGKRNAAHAQSGPLAVPPLGPRASSGHAWRLWLARHSQGKRPAHWAPGHCLGCSSEPLPKPPISPAFDHAGNDAPHLGKWSEDSGVEGFEKASKR